MLVLSRKPSEEIRIGNGITIKVLRIKGQSVRIGIEAPSDVRIVRSEIEVVDDDHVEGAGRVSANVSASANDSTDDSTDGSGRVRCPNRLMGPRKPANSTLRMLAARRRENRMTRSIAAAFVKTETAVCAAR